MKVMATRQTARDYALYVGCLLASVAINIAVARSFDLVGDVVPAFALNGESSGILIIAIATELTVESCRLLNTVLQNVPRIGELPILKRHVSKFPKLPAIAVQN